MRKKLFGILSAGILSFIYLLSGSITAFASQGVGRPTPSPMPGEQVFDIAPVIGTTASTTGLPTLGIVLWIIVGILLIAIAVFMVINIIKYRKAEILRIQAIKPTLIISQGYTKSRKKRF